jgi:hypothetical protein
MKKKYYSKKEIIHTGIIGTLVFVVIPIIIPAIAEIIL